MHARTSFRRPQPISSSVASHGLLKMAAAANWESDICGCCSVKDCGCGCCCKLYCTGPCIWGAAIERAGLGSMPMCCIAVTCCSPCAIIKGRMDVAEKYGIKENLLMNVLMTCCCEPCSCIQVINQVHFSPVPNHLKAFRFASRCPRPGPTWPTLPPPASPLPPNPCTHGHSARKPLSPKCPTDSRQGELYLGLLRRGDVGEWRSRDRDHGALDRFGN